MRFLKNKIQKAHEILKERSLEQKDLSADYSIPEKSPLVNSEEHISPDLKYEAQSTPKIRSAIKTDRNISTKNLIANYANAIASFAISSTATPYLRIRLQNEVIALQEFISYIHYEKSNMGGIKSFRAKLLVDDTDNVKTVACKRVFQWIAEVFIRYHSVKWITDGKVSDKETYLNYRFKMLRRIQNPRAFTHI